MVARTHDSDIVVILEVLDQIKGTKSGAEDNELGLLRKHSVYM